MTTGTIGMSVGSRAVIGSGTVFLKELTVGGYLIIAQDLTVYKIASITDNFNATLDSPMQGLVGNIYSNLTFMTSNGDFTPVLGMPIPGPHMINSSAILNRAFTIIDRELPTDPT